MTLKEIASLAGVSPAAVSLVLNNKPGISDKKRQEVFTLLQKYNYSSSRHPRKTAEKNLLFLKYIRNGHLVEENAGFISTIMDSIEAECRKQKYTLRIVVSNDNLEKTISEIDFSSIDGIFMLGTELDRSAYPVLEKISVPYIVIDNNMPHFPCNTITMNNHDMVYEAVKYLASLGFSDIGYFRSNMWTQNFEERAQAFYQASETSGLIASAEYEFLLEPTMLGAYASMKQYLQTQRNVPKCCFADNDTIAIGAMKALKEFHYKIPEDVCVMGFDDIQFAAVNSPSLTTMQVPKDLIGKLAVRSLNDSIHYSEHRNCKIQVGGSIILRHSTLLS